MADPAARLASVLARVADGFFQQAYVVDDLEAAETALTTALGCTPFVSLPAASLPYRYRGREVECAVALGFARSGGVQIELLQPVSGEGIHVEFLATNGPGAHHLGFLVGDLAAELSFAADAGFDEAMSGTFGRLRFAYLDTWDEFGAYVELVEDPDGVMAQLMPWRIGV
jgi:methylmalonyl-CoA/ethylmalonyl-CoA epimerase